MYNQKWKAREEGIKEFINGMENAFAKATDIRGADVNDQNAGMSPMDRCNYAIIRNMNEMLKDKVMQIINNTIPMVDMYVDICVKIK